ncbi:MAG: nitroreductase family protein [Anaerolineae bacterium]
MDTLEAIFTRHSVRRYKDTAIPKEDLEEILEAGRQAPSAANRQPWHFVVVGDPEQKRELAQACSGQTWMAEAAYILVGVGLPEVSEDWYPVDVAIAMQNIVLAAHSLGYGTCWIGAFSEEAVKEVCQIPPELDVVACTPLGVPDIEPSARARKDWDEVFSADVYGQELEL